MPSSVVAFVDDLMFESRIRANAEALGVPLTVVRSLAKLDERLAAGEDATLIVDLDAQSGDPVEAIRRARALASPPRTVAFLSHVQVDLARAAREAGADEVLARSAFVTRLPQLLRGGEST